MLGVEIAKWSSAGSIFTIAVLLGIDNQPTSLEEFEGCMCVVVIKHVASSFPILL